MLLCITTGIRVQPYDTMYAYSKPYVMLCYPHTCMYEFMCTFIFKPYVMLYYPHTCMYEFMCTFIFNSLTSGRSVNSNPASFYRYCPSATMHCFFFKKKLDNLNGMQRAGGSIVRCLLQASAGEVDARQQQLFITQSAAAAASTFLQLRGHSMITV